MKVLRQTRDIAKPARAQLGALALRGDVQVVTVGGLFRPDAAARDDGAWTVGAG